MRPNKTIKEDTRMFGSKSASIPNRFIVILLIIIIQGCATNVKYERKDSMNLASVDVIRYESPKLREPKIGAMIAGAILAGGAGAAIASTFGEKSSFYINGLISDKFVFKVKEEIPGFPRMVVQSEPVNDDQPQMQRPYIELRTKNFALGYMGLAFGGGYGLVVESVAMFFDKQGEVLWRKSFAYVSGNFKRSKSSVEEFKLDNGKILVDEINFAADTIAMDFVKHLKTQ
jgi:hypothetical protein